jgi:hypothetical protein
MMRLGCALLFAAAASGCAARGLDWSLSFADETVRGQARRIEAQIHEGACPGTTLLYSVDLRMGRDDAPDPPRLSEGRYCFSARAANASCAWIAEAEATVDLPRDGDAAVTLLLGGVGGGADCPPSSCTDGECAAAPDGGTITPGVGDVVVAATCPGDTSCGGDPFGDWRYTGACSVEPSIALRERCPTYTVVSGGGTVTGSLRVDGTTATQSLAIVGATCSVSSSRTRAACLRTATTWEAAAAARSCSRRNSSGRSATPSPATG